MSRSFRKPVKVIEPNDKSKRKRSANKRVRRFSGDLPKGSFFKRLYEPENIIDSKEFTSNIELCRK